MKSSCSPAKAPPLPAAIVSSKILPFLSHFYQLQSDQATFAGTDKKRKSR